MNEERDKKLALMVELLGGDLCATRTANALARSGILTPDDVLATPHEELADIRTVGVLGCLRLGELRGSLRPGGRGRVDMTGNVLQEIYEKISRMAANREHGLLSCALHGTHHGLPPEIRATVGHFERRYTLVLTPSEIPHDSHTEGDF